MIFINNEAHGHLVAAGMQSRYAPQVMTVLSRAEICMLPGVLTAVEVVYGGVIYENYTGVSLLMHAVGLRPNWLNRELLWIAFDYPFRKLKCHKVMVSVASTNPKSLAFTEHLGFTLEARIADAVPGGDVLILSMERKDCRWLKPQPRNMRRPVLGRAVDSANVISGAIH